jgi:hypothetical protein
MITSSERSAEAKTASRVVTSSGTPTVKVEGLPSVTVRLPAPQADAATRAAIAAARSTLMGLRPVTEEREAWNPRRRRRSPSRKERDPPLAGDQVVAPLLHHEAPTPARDLDTETEEAQPGNDLERQAQLTENWASGTAVFGSRCRTRIPGSCCPAERAASTNSADRREGPRSRDLHVNRNVDHGEQEDHVQETIACSRQDGHREEDHGKAWSTSVER